MDSNTFGSLVYTAFGCLFAFAPCVFFLSLSLSRCFVLIFFLVFSCVPWAHGFSFHKIFFVPKMCCVFHFCSIINFRYAACISHTHTHNIIFIPKEIPTSVALCIRWLNKRSANDYIVPALFFGILHSSFGCRWAWYNIHRAQHISQAKTHTHAHEMWINITGPHQTIDLPMYPTNTQINIWWWWWWCWWRRKTSQREIEETETKIREKEDDNNNQILI